MTLHEPVLQTITFSLEELSVVLEYLGGVQLPSLSLEELQRLEPRDQRLLRASARRALQARELLTVHDEATPQLDAALIALLSDCLQSPICDIIIEQDAQTAALTAYYAVADGCIAHETLSAGLHRLTRHSSLSSRDFALIAIGALPDRPHGVAATLASQPFNSGDQPADTVAIAAEISAVVGDEQAAALTQALTAPTRSVLLQRALAQPDGAPHLQRLALYWADNDCWLMRAGTDSATLQVTPAGAANVAPLLATLFD